MAEETPKKEEQETFSKEEVETIISDKLSEQEESFDEKIAAIKDEVKSDVKPPAKESPKYVDESWTPSNYNDMMAKVVDVVKKHVPSANVEEVTKSVMDSLQTKQTEANEESTAADKAWDKQVKDLKEKEKLDDKTITEILTKATKWNKENPEGLITSMPLAYEYWKKGEKSKPRIPGAPTNAAEDEPEQKIFSSVQEAQAYWLATHGE